MAKRAKQGHLSGMEPPSIPEIESAADELDTHRGQRMTSLELEIKAADLLMVLMKKHKLKVYEMPNGKRVEMVNTEKVKIKRPKEENGDGKEDEE